MLVSCQSAGQGVGEPSAGQGALAALGPQLVGVGIPAVLGMQGNVSMETAQLFMPAFFKALRQENGLIDAAVATARGALLHPPKESRVEPRPDWWAPVLFMRLRNGNLWGETGIRTDNRDFPWRPLLAKLSAGSCTAFLGSGMLEKILGRTRENARRLAEDYRFPLAPQDRDDLPQVAQFLKVVGDDDFPYLELAHHLQRQLRSRHPDALGALDRNATLDEMIVGVGQWVQQHRPPEPHALLARLPFPLFVTTNADSLLERTLAQTPAGDGKLKQPQARTFHPSQLAQPLDRAFAEATPLVYYLFGHFQGKGLRTPTGDEPVLTEDDYFDFLMNVRAASDKIPPEVREAMVNSTLVFLGFRVEEWDFRILARSIKAINGSALQKKRKHIHVAVQLAPGERFLDPERARDYLERQFQFGEQPLSIYWGSLEAFLTELVGRLERDQG
jgi:hypothetical protein